MSEEAPRRRPRPIGVAVLAGIALLGLGIIAALSLDEGDTDPIEIEGAGVVQKLLGGIQQEGPVLGSDSAAVTVQILNDMQCEGCADFQLQVVEPLVEGYVRPGVAVLEYHHYALGDRTSGIAFYGAVAAGLQGRQWQFIQLFFLNQEEAISEGVTPEFLERIAAAILELNVEQWQRDFDEPEVQATIDEDADYTAELRLPAEPAVIVEGPGGSATLEDSPSLDEVEQAIQEAKG